MISQQSSATKDKDKDKDINKDISRDINIDDLSIKSRNQTTSYRKLKLP